MNRLPLLAFLAFLPVADALAADAGAPIAVARKEVELTYAAEATLEAVRQATVAAQVPGRVLDVKAEAGQTVRQGQVLMRIDAREAAENLAAAKANLAQAEASFNRTRDLHAKKFVSAAALDKADADLKAARAAAAASGASLSYATVGAPIGGIVAQRHVEMGEMAALGKPLVTIFDPKGLRAIASIPQYKLAELRGTPKARLEFPELGLWVDAARVEVLPTVDARTHTGTARVYLPEDVKQVAPGMFVRVHFVTGRGQKLTVPPQAVVRRGEVAAVYVLDEKGQPRMRQVRLGETVAGGEIEVLAGLSDGDRLAPDPVAAGISLKAAAK
ncbi:MAG TPA: efflux RND transporter periplasmic adaptor subunit [Rhodocyclaceae bacterium]|nr:efflux RND transporter periplasmic adaptor subunit [Rhodocyclaceae bacterium]